MSKTPNRPGSSGDKKTTSVDKALHREKKTSIRASKKMLLESTGQLVSQISQPPAETSVKEENRPSPSKLYESTAPDAMALNRNCTTGEFEKNASKEQSRLSSHKSDTAWCQHGSVPPVEDSKVELNSSVSRTNTPNKQKLLSEENVKDQRPDLHAGSLDILKISTQSSTQSLYLPGLKQTEKAANFLEHNCVDRLSDKTQNESVSTPKSEQAPELAQEINDESGTNKNILPAGEPRHRDDVAGSHGAVSIDRVGCQSSVQYVFEQQNSRRSTASDDLRDRSINNQKENVDSPRFQMAEKRAEIVSKLFNNTGTVVINWARQLEDRHHLSEAHSCSVDSTSYSFIEREKSNARIRFISSEKVEPTAKIAESLTPDLLTAKTSGSQRIECRNRIYTSHERIPERRYIMGIEVALAAIIAAAGATRARSQLGNETSSTDQVIPNSIDQEMNSDSLSSANGPEGAHPRTQSAVSSQGIRQAHRLNETEECLLDHHMGKTGGKEDEPVVLSTIPVSKPELDDVNCAKRVSRVIKRPTTLISLADTLISIAERLFGNPNVAWLIADLNVAEAKESWINGKRILEFKNRQSICLPVDQEIAEFLLKRPKHARPENLITIVQKTQIDRELLESSWRPVVGGGAKEGKQQESKND